MKQSFRKLPLFVCMVLIAVLSMSVTVFAHGVKYQGLEGGKVQFTFDDGSPFNGAFVNVYDANREIIDTGETDADGYFDFSGYTEELAAIEAQDPAGHRSVYHIEEGVMAEPGVFVAQGGGEEATPEAPAATAAADTATATGQPIVITGGAPAADSTSLIVIVAIAAVAIVGIVAVVAIYFFASGKKKAGVEYVEVVEESVK